MSCAPIFGCLQIWDTCMCMYKMCIFSLDLCTYIRWTCVLLRTTCILILWDLTSALYPLILCNLSISYLNWVKECIHIFYKISRCCNWLRSMPFPLKSIKLFLACSRWRSNVTWSFLITSFTYTADEKWETFLFIAQARISLR